MITGEVPKRCLAETVRNRWIRLSPLEQQFVALVCQGKKNSRIAPELDYLARDGEDPPAQRMLKLNTRSRAGLKKAFDGFKFEEE